MLAINEEVVAVLTDTEYIVDQYVICQAEMWNTESSFLNMVGWMDLLLFFVPYDVKLRAFGVRTVCWTDEDIWGRYFELWETILDISSSSNSLSLIDQ